jgi:(p)ppGpp synthase/HD superfamily hydrolase
MEKYGVVGRAYGLAAKYHDGYLRKYSFLPYITHPVEVHAILLHRFGPAGDLEDLNALYAAALLHDVLEDTEASEDDLSKHLPDSVVSLVKEVTNPAKLEDGNRAYRAAVNREHVKNGSAAAHSLKVADIISNTKSIADYDPEYAKVYLPEKWEMLKVLDKADPELHARAVSIINKNAEKLGMKLA